MLNMISGWPGKFEINGTQYETADALKDALKGYNGNISIKLIPKEKALSTDVEKALEMFMEEDDFLENECKKQENTTEEENIKVESRQLPKGQLSLFDLTHEDDLQEPILTAADISMGKEYIVTVKPYMLKKATESFNFMKEWNDDNPMPMLKMVGTPVKITKGMVKMDLHGEILEKETAFCLRCGKPITNPVSRFFGFGPLCGGHNYVNPFGSQQELDSAVEEYKKKVSEIRWNGWIFKSAITEVKKH